MNTITIKNLSTFIDSAALVRVAHFLAGDEYAAVHDANGGKAVKINRRRNTFTVTDVDWPGDPDTVAPTVEAT